MHLTPHHHGGYLLRVARAERDVAIREIAAKAAKVIVVAESPLAASLLARRLTLRGLPVRQWASPSDGSVAAFMKDDFGALITHRQHDETVPWSSSDHPTAVIHSGSGPSRSYQTLLGLLQAPVHITLVDPEDTDAEPQDVERTELRPQADVLSQALRRSTVAVHRSPNRRLRLLSS